MPYSARTKADLQSFHCRDASGKGNAAVWAAVCDCDIGHEGEQVNKRTKGRIAKGAMGVACTALIVATVIQPHIQMYLTIWLFTLVSSVNAVAHWMVGPDHGALGQARMRLAMLRLEEAYKEEHETASRKKRLETVA
ncbi:hypothetical protein [Nonomuraea typhae]|uniref:Uncharacterized protein n=1 Tax=Nonomuraea typhae TaxID=2603600 RepID=A0ABW7YM60_9ACTN